MSLLKKPKKWAALALVASIACISVVAWCMFSVKGGTMGFRDAAGLTRLTVQISACVAIFSAVIFIFSLIRRELISSLMSGIAALMLSALVFVAVTSQPSEYDSPAGPALNDISTDTLDPPQFDAVAGVRPSDSNTLDYPGESAVARQADAFPDIAPIQSKLSSQAAFQRSLKIVSDSGWELIAEDDASGIIEAVDTTAFFGFKDDIVIRVRENGNSSIIDIRSHSRVGRGDRGQNAKRIRQFIEDF